MTRRNSDEYVNSNISKNGSKLEDLNKTLKRITGHASGNNHIDTFNEFTYRHFAISFLLADLERDMMTELIKMHKKVRRKRTGIKLL